MSVNLSGIRIGSLPIALVAIVVEPLFGILVCFVLLLSGWETVTIAATANTLMSKRSYDTVFSGSGYEPHRLHSKDFARCYWNYYCFIMIKTHQAAALHNLWISNLKLCIKMTLCEWIFASIAFTCTRTRFILLHDIVAIEVYFASLRFILAIFACILLNWIAIESAGLIRFISKLHRIFAQYSHCL